MRKPIPLAPLQNNTASSPKSKSSSRGWMRAWRRCKRAQANLKRYKAAVLKAACEGRLVSQDPNDEPASKLLERILEQRRKGAVAMRQGRVTPSPQVRRACAAGYGRVARVAGWMVLGES